MRYFLLLFFVLSSLSVFSDRKEDSLLLVVTNANHDSIKLKAIYDLGTWFEDTDPFKSISYMKKAVELSLKIKNEKKLAWSYMHLGAAYCNMELYAESLEYFFKSLEIAEAKKYTTLLVRSYNQIGIIYSLQKQHENSLEFFKKFTEIAEQTQNKDYMARGYNNIGISYKNLKKLDIANHYYFKALSLFQEANFTQGIVSAYLNIGVNEFMNNRLDSAFHYYNMALDIAIKEKDFYALSGAYANRGEIYFKRKDFVKSLRDYDSSVFYANFSRSHTQLKDAYEGLYKVYQEKGDIKKAHYYLLRHIQMKDSLFNEETTSSLNNFEKNYNMIKKQKEIELLEKNEEIKTLELSKTKNRLTTIIIISVLLGLAVFFIYKRFVDKKKDNKILFQQKKEIEIQKKEILDSIFYAKRIQQSVLPTTEELNKTLKTHFVLFQPKDIVSGDFYWIAQLITQKQKREISILAVVDCTGHGVPGAFMSLIGYLLLNQTILHPEINSPGEVLDYLNQELPNVFRAKAKNETIKDGMDISICAIDYAAMEISYSMANNPIYLIRKGELILLAPDRFAVSGETSNEKKKFNSQTIKVEHGDSLYLFTDGFADQFGGPFGKKYKYKKLQELLISINHEEMLVQKEILNQTFSEWKGQLEQVDDVCIVGIKI